MTDDIDVKRLRLEPGDVVIMSVPDILTREQSVLWAEAIRAALLKAGHANPVLFKPHAVTLEVLSRAELEARTLGGDRK